MTRCNNNASWLLAAYISIFVFLPNLVSISVAGAQENIFKLLIEKPGNEDGFRETHVSYLNDHLRFLSSDRNCECCELITDHDDVIEAIGKWMRNRDEDEYEAKKASLGYARFPSHILKLNLKMDMESRGFWYFTLTLTNIESRTDSGHAKSELLGLPPLKPKTSEMQRIYDKWTIALKKIFDEVIGCGGSGSNGPLTIDPLSHEPPKEPMPGPGYGENGPVVISDKVVDYMPGVFGKNGGDAFWKALQAKAEVIAEKIRQYEDAGFYLHRAQMEGMADGIENKGIKDVELITFGCLEPGIAILKYEQADLALARLRLCEFKSLIFKKLGREFSVDRETATDIPTGEGQGGSYRGVKIEIDMINSFGLDSREKEW